MSDLQDALDWYDLRGATFVNKEWDPIVEAARLVANATTYKWCEEHHSGVNWRTGTDIMEGVERCDAHRLLAMPGQEAAVVSCEVVDAALTPPEDTP